MTTERKLMTAEEFVQLPDDGRRLELINGEVVEMPPGNLEHGHAGLLVGGRLAAYAAVHNAGYVSGLDPGIRLTRDPDTVRAPDVCFYYTCDRVSSPEARRRGGNRPASIAPLLVLGPRMD